MLDIGPDAESLDDLLEEDYSDGFEEKEKIKNIGSSIKVADDDYMDVDDDAWWMPLAQFYIDAAATPLRGIGDNRLNSVG